MEEFAGSGNLQCEPVEAQCDSATVTPTHSVIAESKITSSHELSLPVYDANEIEFDNVEYRSDELPVVVDEAESNAKHSLDNGIKDVHSSNKGMGPTRSWEDGYNWRKYGQKQIKGNESPRSYYKCSHPNCQVKKQVERSHDGRVADVIYRGTHEHPKPQFVSYMATPTMLPVQREKIDGKCTSQNTEDMLSNGNDQTSHNTKLNCVPEPGEPKGTEEPSVAGDKSVVDLQVRRIGDEIHGDGDDPESKRRCLSFSSDMIRDAGPNHVQCSESVEAQALISTSNENVTAKDASHEMNPRVTAPNQPFEMVSTSKALVPFEVEVDGAQQTEGYIGVNATQINRKGASPSITADRLWGDGYNWRKYGQKQIKGNEFPRSYYRCTHPSCQAKKQLECSHDGQITDIVYKGEHSHPKPQPSSHMAVGRILSIQEEGFERVSSVKQSYDKSFYDQTTHHTELSGNPGLFAAQTSDADVQGEGSKLNMTDDKVEQNGDVDSKCGDLRSGMEINTGAATRLDHQQCKLSVEVQGQGQSQLLTSSPSAKMKDTTLALSPSINKDRNLLLQVSAPLTLSNSPVYMVTSRGIVPVEVDSEEKRQKQRNLGNGADTEESNQNGLSLSMTERLLENAYHWRKYGQKNIKGSEFPRSYYRCTHPNCQVKMQLEKSHDGRIIEIIYKGKHDHPKPQPVTRMAIGAILSLEEDTFERISDSPSDKSSNGHVQGFGCTNSDPIPGLCSSVENVKTAGHKLSRSISEVDYDNDMESKRRKKDGGDLDVTPVIRTPREPRVVVETLSEVDVVDDGYRWQKYGRKLVKGNSHPRNYYRCSHHGCAVKKHVERAANNPRAVITTYEGKHNHDLPSARIATGYNTAGDTGGGGSCPEEEIIDVEPIRSEPFEAAPPPFEAHNGDLIEKADKERLISDDGRGFSFDTPSFNHKIISGVGEMEN